MNNPTLKLACRSRLFRKLQFAVPALVLTAITASMMFPISAYAKAPSIDVFDLGMSLKNWLCYVIFEGACALLNAYNFIMKHVGGTGTTGILSQSFNTVLGTDMYNLTKNVYNGAIVPVAESILALFMLVQLIKISQRIDATATLPAVKDIVFLAVSYTLMHWFILNSLDILQAIYQIVADNIIPAMGAARDNTEFFSEALSTDPIDGSSWNDVSIGGALLVLIISLLSLLIGMVAYVVALVVAFARAWQIYVYAAFSAIPVALLGFDETRQMGVNFLKNFVATCLAGAIMVFLLIAYPYIVSGSIVSVK